LSQKKVKTGDHLQTADNGPVFFRIGIRKAEFAVGRERTTDSPAFSSVKPVMAWNFFFIAIIRANKIFSVPFVYCIMVVFIG
jgi:hypothetical protein